MEYNVYAPPMASVAEAPRPAAATREFYVVARGKFIVLLVCTLGLYQIYWAYMHWARYRRHSGEELWPVARSLFQVFFSHALARRIEQSLGRGGHRVAGALGTIAGGFVVFQIASKVLDRLAYNSIGSPVTDWLSLLVLLPLGWCMWQLQAAANLACGDAAGTGNRRLTWANWLWIVPGSLLVLLVLVGLLLPQDVMAE
jgi:hypothetical protein